MSAKRSQGDYVIGVDIGGTKMLAAVIDDRFKVVARGKKKSRSKNAGETSEDRLIQVVHEALDASGVESVRGIGVGSPGPLDPQTGVIVDTPNLAWKNFPLAETLEKEFGVPVAVDNDVNVGTYGEWCFGEIKDCKHVVGIFPGTGIGGGIIIDGKLLHGFSGAAGEIGHMTVEVDGPYCGCGKRGCLEAVASRIAIAKEAAALAARDDAPHLFAQCGVSLARIRSGDLADAIAAGDHMVEAVVRKAAYYTGIAAGNLVNVLSPEAVVLGGGLVEAMEKLYLEEVKRGIKEHAMPFLREGLRVTAAKLGDDAVVMGAARLIHDRLAEKR